MRRMGVGSLNVSASRTCGTVGLRMPEWYTATPDDGPVLLQRHASQNKTTMVVIMTSALRSVLGRQ
jgi:hypothetical protein